MQTTVSSAGVPHPGAAKPDAFEKTSLRSRINARKPDSKARKPFRRPYKPLPTTRYLVAGLTAILMSMGLITGAMSSVAQFDTMPWSPAQELHWDPFQKNDTLGLDIGGLNQLGHRSEDAITQNTILDWLHRSGHRGIGNPHTKPPVIGSDANDGPIEADDTPSPTADSETSSPNTESDAPSPEATFEVPGAAQTPTSSQAPKGEKPPVAMGKSFAVGSTGPKA